jgi:hypothetical protein
MLAISIKLADGSEVKESIRKAGANTVKVPCADLAGDRAVESR